MKRLFRTPVRDFATYRFDLPAVDVKLLETAQQRIEDRQANLVARVTLAAGESLTHHIEMRNGYPRDNEQVAPATGLPVTDEEGPRFEGRE